MNLFTAKWPFYVSGPLLALLTVFSLYVFNDVIGMGDALTVATEYCGDAVMTRQLDGPPPLDWQMGLLIGLFIGALIATLIGGKFEPEMSPEKAGSFTEKTLRTVGGGMLGGFLVMLGIQLAGDSVLGQLAAAMQLSGSAWVFLIALVIAGGLLAILFERRGEGGGKAAGGKAAGGKSSAARTTKGK